MYFFLVAFAVLGAGLKYIDNAFDEQIFNKKIAYTLAPLLGVLGAYTMVMSAVSATILLAIVLGVFLKGKVDNWAFLTGLLVTIGSIILAGIQLLILPLIVLTIGALADEIGNDLIDKNNYLHGAKRWQRLIGHFFDQRWAMKVVILSLVGIGIIPFYFFIAMFLFDEAYLCISWYSQRQKRSPKVIRDHIPREIQLVSSDSHSTGAYAGANKVFMTQSIFPQMVGSPQNDHLLSVTKERQITLLSIK